MAHDMNLENQSGAAFRADLNNALLALVSQSVGVEPETKYSGQMWWDYANGLIKIRNYSNTAWVTVAGFDGATYTPYRAGAALGTAAAKNTGTASGDVALLGTGGLFAATVLPAMAGATESVDGSAGIAPKPLAGDNTKILWGDGTYKAGGATFTTEKDLTASQEWTGLPAGLTRVEVAIEGITITPAYEPMIQIGGLLAYTTAGYDGRAVRAGFGNSLNSNAFNLINDVTTPGLPVNALAVLTRLSGHTWMLNSTAMILGGATVAGDTATGKVTVVNGPLNRLKIILTGTATITAGVARLAYW